MTKSADVYLVCDPWQIIEENWNCERNLVSESVFSLGNEYMGVRGYAEEGISAETLQGSYFNGIYEEEDLNKNFKGIITKTHFMVNSVDWLYIEIRADDELLDTASCKTENFRRVLDMRDGTLKRSFDWHTKGGPVVHLEFVRFLCMDKTSSPAGSGAAYQKINFSVSGGDVSLTVVIANNFNTSHGCDKKNYWNMIHREWLPSGAAIQGKTIRTGQQIFSGFTFKTNISVQCGKKVADKFAGFEIILALKNGENAWIEKSIYNYVSKERDIPADAGDSVWKKGWEMIKSDMPDFNTALECQRGYWDAFWKNADIKIEGDPLNQQGIRFCIFQMHQAYNGYDPANNIGAKGLTGEAYNGHTFWDVETYCLPFYLFSNIRAARNLLSFRYAALDAARDRARQLDCSGACYPIATLNGEEACSLWQHASLQFQPSTAVAYGIRHYVKLSGDTDFLYEQGVEMLVEISRFLASRGCWNNDSSGFGFYAVMGPDEFHMMVNHSSYTNFMAKKTFEYTEQVLQTMEKEQPKKFTAFCKKLKLTQKERMNFVLCADKMIILYNEKTKLFEQHEGYYNLPRIEISEIPITDFPLYQNWSYDRIYRTSMIKQPDVLMFLFLFNHEFSIDIKKANYNYYEPNTIHESSLSPSIHSIFAAELGKRADAFRFFGFAARTDLDNYNRNTAEGLHIASIAAAWMNIVYGFGGLRSSGDELSLNPVLPEEWTEYEFGILYRNVHIRIKITKGEVVLSASDEIKEAIPLCIYGKQYNLDSSGIKISIN
ncbi:MAG: family 65 glycosyl hydrolase [Treponema sp.]|nr:family 65 glycosyl hydrolase [Treponema sp.]